MKKIILSFIVLALGIAAHSQAFNASYTYDANGNRLTATIVWLQTSLKSDLLSASEVLSSQTIAKNDTTIIPQQGYTKPSIDSLSGTKITVYPNPTHGVLLIQFSGISESELSSIGNMIIVYNINGQKVLQQSPLEQLNNINLQSLSNGNYVMTIQIGTQVKTYTIIKN